MAASLLDGPKSPTSLYWAVAWTRGLFYCSSGFMVGNSSTSRMEGLSVSSMPYVVSIGIVLPFHLSSQTIRCAMWCVMTRSPISLFGWNLLF